LLVTNTPILDGGAGVAALASALGGGSIKNSTSLLTHYHDRSERRRHNEILLPRGTDGPLRTLYGTVWSTTSAGQVPGTSIADSAYGHEALPLHTDMTYHRDPPGLQIFTMIQPSSDSGSGGGASIFGDGFAVADRLRRTHPEAFDMLANTVRRYRCVDYATGWHLEASGPVITVVDHNTNNRGRGNNVGEIVMIRHNDLDRLPDLPPPRSSTSSHDSDDFYTKLQEAHRAWDEILADDDVRLVIRLQPRDAIVVANQVRNAPICIYIYISIRS
jgi:alpha-ketoglutarate-dependent taurine dioxygenase